MPYIMDLTFSKYDFEKPGERITGYTISTTNTNYSILIYRRQWEWVKVHETL